MTGRALSTRNHRFDPNGQDFVVAEPQTFDWQASSVKDTSWRGKSRSWIEDKPGTARALNSCKTLAVWLPEEQEVAGPLGGGNDGIGRRSLDDHNFVFPLAQRGRPGGSELEVGEEGVSNALRGGSGGSWENRMMIGRGVRRLLPVECERLQSLPDGWTDVPRGAPDSRRYAALGDAVTVNVAEWIGRRLAAAERWPQLESIDEVATSLNKETR